jgi:hypothetical protein
MVTPRAESSPSNCATPGEISRSRDNDSPFQVLAKLFRFDLPLPERQRLRLANLDEGLVRHQRERGCVVGQRSGQDEVVVPVHQDTDHTFPSLQSRVSNRVTDCEMVDDLS